MKLFRKLKDRCRSATRFFEMLRSCEKIYGVKPNAKNAEELSLWLMAHDPYIAELLAP